MLRKILASSTVLGLTMLSPLSMAQSVGTGPISPLPASGTLTILVMLIGVVAIAYAALSKKKHYIAAIAGPALVLTSVTALIVSPELRALPAFQFTASNPNGELIDLSGAFSSGSEYFEITNTSGTNLKVVSVTQPSIDDCPLIGIGKSTTESTTAKGNNEVRLRAPGYPACTVGDVFEKGATCTLDFIGFCGIPT